MVMHAMIKALPPASWGSAEQGFIDQRGNFLTREEAWIIAVNNNQIIRHLSSSGVLYSENLY